MMFLWLMILSGVTSHHSIIRQNIHERKMREGESGNFLFESKKIIFFEEEEKQNKK